MVDLFHLHIHLVSRNNSVKKAKEKPQTYRLLSMDELEKAVVKIIIALIAMFAVMFSACIGLDAYKASLGIVKECKCNK